MRIQVEAELQEFSHRGGEEPTWRLRIRSNVNGVMVAGYSKEYPKAFFRTAFDYVMRGAVDRLKEAGAEYLREDNPPSRTVEEGS